LDRGNAGLLAFVPGNVKGGIAEHVLNACIEDFHSSFTQKFAEKFADLSIFE
jgi:hypothetical protein